MIAHLWQSTACAALAALLAWMLRESPARVRHGIWAAASIKFLIPLWIVAAAGRRAGAWLLPEHLPGGSVAVRWLEQSLSLWSVGTVGQTGFGGAALLLMQALGAVWIAGAAGVAVARWRRWRAIERSVACGRPLEHGREADALSRVLPAARRGTAVTLTQCESRMEPGVMGVLRPTLLWPSGLSERLTDAELDAVIAHEVRHVERGDNLIGWVQVAVEVLFWFHPVVWWIGARLVHERETACDEEVVQMGQDRRTYAEAILKVCGFCLRSPLDPVAGVGSSDLPRRIERIMTRSAAAALTVPSRLLLGVAAAAIVVAPFVTGALQASGIATGSTTSASGNQERRVYRKGDGVVLPKLISELKPVYTKAALEAKIQGGIKMEAVVLENGDVGEVTVIESLDRVYGLDDEAVKALKQWRFEPGTKDKRPVAVRVEVEMTFTLR